jgi:hypothetical protein
MGDKSIYLTDQIISEKKFPKKSFRKRETGKKKTKKKKYVVLIWEYRNNTPASVR